MKKMAPKGDMKKDMKKMSKAEMMKKHKAEDAAMGKGKKHA